MHEELVAILTQLTTGDEKTMRDAKKRLNAWWKQQDRPISDDRCQEIAVAYLPWIGNFNTLDIPHQVAFIEALWIPFLVAGNQRDVADLFSSFILMVIQHSSGKVRRALVRVSDWFVLSLHPVFESEAKTEEKRQYVAWAQEQFCSLVFQVEALLEKYNDPGFQRYTYVSGIPAGVYKSLQQLMTEVLLRSPKYTALYEKFLARAVRGAPQFSHKPEQSTHTVEPDTEDTLLVPRSLEELGHFFECIVTGEIPGEEDVRRNAPISMLERGDFVRLHQEGILDRMFRRWMQTNWSWRQWTTKIKGETPRQELGISHPGLQDGTATIALRCEEQNGVPSVIPTLLDVGRGNALFLSGVQRGRFPSSVPTDTERRDDAEFASFLAWMRRGGGLTDIENDPYAPWRWFLNNVSTQLVAALPLIVGHAERMRLAEEIRFFLHTAVKAQGVHLDDFIFFDELFYATWEALRTCEKIPTLDALQAQIVEERHKHTMDHAKRLLFFLGKFFDKYVLYPADRYFGALEIVWTDQASFVGDLAAISAVWKERQPIPEDTASDPMLVDTVQPAELWFSPCTAFRVLGEFRDV